MRRAVAFAEVLDEKLAGEAQTSWASWGASSPRIATAAVFFEFAAYPARPARLSAAVGFGGTPVRAATARPASADRPRRLMAPAAQAALDRLLALGADLRQDFTVHELRSAFRALARRYHPDRHPGIGAAEKTRLSRQFAELHDFYRELQTAALPAAA